MHIPDGFLSLTICALMYVLSTGFLILSWKKAKNSYSNSLTPTLAVSSGFVFAAQMINFPILYGTSGHLLGGTFISILFGPYIAILSMTIVLMMQALIFADGGLSTFGANVFNMAVIGGLSYFIVKSLMQDCKSRQRFFLCFLSIMDFNGSRGTYLRSTDRIFSPILRSWRSDCYCSSNVILACTNWFWRSSNHGYSVDSVETHAFICYTPFWDNFWR